MGKKGKKRPTTTTEKPAAVKTNNDVVALIEKNSGNEAYLKCNYTQAIEHYTTGIALSARNPLLLVVQLVNRATAFLRVKEYQYAVEDSTSALLLDENVRAHICRAFGYFFMQNYSKAFEDYEMASKLQPNNTPLQKALQQAKEGLSAQLQKIKDVAAAAAHTGKKVRDTALEWIGDFGLLSIDEESLPNTSPIDKHVAGHTSAQPQKGANPNHPSVPAAGKSSIPLPPLIPVGDWLYGVEMEDYDVLIQYPPDELKKLAVDAKLAGNSAFKARRYLSAVGHYSKAIWLDCHDGVYYSNRGIAYIKLGRWAEAVTDCSMSLVYGPSMKAYLRRGTAWAAMGHNWLGIADYKSALDYEPSNRDCLKGIECALTILDDETQAALAATPGNEQLLSTAQRIKVEFKALTALRASAEQKAEPPKPTPTKSQSQPQSRPNNNQPPQTNADAKPQSDFAKLQDMLSNFSNMIADDKLNTTALMGRADVYIQIGDVDKAIADYRLGLRLDPDNPELLKRWQFAVKKRKGAN